MSQAVFYYGRLAMKVWTSEKIKRVTGNFVRHPLGYSFACLTLLNSKILEKRLGIDTYGYTFPEEERNLYGDASPYTATSYLRLNKMLSYLKLKEEDVAVDLGCGVGRPVFLLGTRRLRKVIGVEIRKELVDIARKNLANWKLRVTPIEIIHSDASAFDAGEGTVFFLFNPFGEKTFTKVMENIRKSLVIRPRRVRIVYYCPVYKDFLDAQDWLVPEGEIGKTDILVWSTK